MAQMDVEPARERRLSPREVESVLGRAIELHVRDSAHARGDDLTEADLLRIGHELGLEPVAVRRALAELGGGDAADQGWLARHVGERRAASSRVVRRAAADVRRELEAYLLEVEAMVIERRFPGHTVYVRAKGLVALSLRLVGKLGRRHTLLEAERVEVGVQPLDGGSCCVALAVDLEAKRREHVAVGAVAGAAGGVTGAVLLGLLVTPPLALAAVPLAGTGLLAARLAYRGARAETLERVESLLDRLEHRELRRGPVRALRAFGL